MSLMMSDDTDVLSRFHTRGNYANEHQRMIMLIDEFLTLCTNFLIASWSIATIVAVLILRHVVFATQSNVEVGFKRDDLVV
jgi:hypothetical protein